MKTILSILLLASLISIPAFAFLTMKHFMGHSNCLAAVVGNGRCPGENNSSLLSAISHLDVLKSFSRSVSILFVLLISVWIILFSALNLIWRDFLRFNFRPATFNFSKARKLRWLSFCEHSPSLT